MKVYRVAIPKRTQASLRGLEQMCQYLNERIDLSELEIVEIGSWVGSSAMLFAKYFKNVICIDPFLPFENTITYNYDMKTIEEIFKDKIAAFENIAHIKKMSKDVIINGFETDIIYIDGNHNYDFVKEDIKRAKGKVRVAITGHDYYSKFPGVIQAVNEEFKKPIATFPDSSWIGSLNLKA